MKPWPKQTWSQARAKYVAQRLRMFRENPHCHWCGGLLRLPDPKRGPGWNAPNVATIDHLYPKGHPKRLDGNPERERRRVLACRRCNSSRGNPYVAPQQPKSLEEAWRAAGQWPRMAHQHGALPGEVA